MSPFRRGPHCPDHPQEDARYCRDCWHEINQGTRPDHLIGKHYETQAVPTGAASSISGDNA